jgi:hypothetical protein
VRQLALVEVVVVPLQMLVEFPVRQSVRVAKMTLQAGLEVPQQFLLPWVKVPQCFERFRVPALMLFELLLAFLGCLSQFRQVFLKPLV